MMTCKSYVGGEWICSKVPELITMYNPADLSKVVSVVEYADERRAIDAVNNADHAFKKWRSVSIKKKEALIGTFLDKINNNKKKFAEIITRENGKTLDESIAEINSGLSEARYQLNFLKEALPIKRTSLETRYEPLGVVLLITPWNFPFATIMRKMIPAIITGNTVVVKPSEYTPMTSVFLFSLIQETGFPPGTTNLILGDGKIGSLLTGNDKISAISLTGSTQTGALIKKQISDLNTRFQAEMGGKNTVAVLADADIESAAIDIATNAYACCGQWCTGTSKVVVHSEVAEHLTNLIVEFAGKIKLGNGLERNADMGPLISEVQLDKVKTAVKNNDGAELLFGGKQPSDEKLRNGYFFEPTVFSNVDPNSNLAKEEIFGPVLSIIVEDDLDNMIADVNNTNYGLSFSVYTGIESAGERFINEVEAGLCHLNLPTAYRDPSLPLLGWKNSGYGLPEAGRFALDFFTKPKAVYRKEE